MTLDLHRRQLAAAGGPILPAVIQSCEFKQKDSEETFRLTRVWSH